jgi:hypothetical protein
LALLRHPAVLLLYRIIARRTDRQSTDSLMEQLYCYEQSKPTWALRGSCGGRPVSSTDSAELDRVQNARMRAIIVAVVLGSGSFDRSVETLDGIVHRGCSRKGQPPDRTSCCIGAELAQRGKNKRFRPQSPFGTIRHGPPTHEAPDGGGKTTSWRSINGDPIGCFGGSTPASVSPRARQIWERLDDTRLLKTKFRSPNWDSDALCS